MRLDELTRLDTYTRLAANLASPGAAAGRLSILMYHRVLPHADPMRPSDISAATFAMQMSTLASVFTVLPIDEALHKLESGHLPVRSVCVTFDDGYRDNFDVALPILRSHGFAATVFVTSGVLGNGLMFNDAVIETARHLPTGPHDLAWLGLPLMTVFDQRSRIDLAHAVIRKLKYMVPEARDAACRRLRHGVRVRLPNDLMLKPEQVSELDRLGVAIGGHTLTHATLASLSPREAHRQIVGNRLELSQLLREPPRWFAYPNGRPDSDFTALHTKMVRDAGYEAAFTTAWGQVTREDDRLMLRRCGSFDVGPGRFVARLLRHGRQLGVPARSSLR